jgi:ferredoxin--NADP+ reductase
MCGICRVTVGGQIKFGCVDGPEFDGHQVDFEELTSRLKMYKDVEKQAYDHVCTCLPAGRGC